MHRHEEPLMAESVGVHWLRDLRARARVLLHGDRDRRRNGADRWVRPHWRLALDGECRADGRHRCRRSVRLPRARQPSRAHASVGRSLPWGAGARYLITSGAQSAIPTTLSKVATPPDTTENTGDTRSATTPDST